VIGEKGTFYFFREFGKPNTDFSFPISGDTLQHQVGGRQASRPVEPAGLRLEA
jgi:hypothetical protein